MAVSRVRAVSVPWEQQPQDWAGIAPEYRVGLRQGFIAPRRNATEANAFTVNTSTPQPSTFGIGAKTSGSGAYITAPAEAGTGPWTLVAFGRVRSVGTLNLIAEHAELPGNSVRDRGIGFTAAGQLQGYLYDGVEKTATAPGSVVAGETFLAIATSSGSALTAFMNGASAQVATSNNGYNGYTTPELVIGYGGLATGVGWSGSGADGSDNEIAYVLKYDRAWPLQECMNLWQSPFSVFEPQQILVPVVSSVSAWWPGTESTLNGWTSSTGGTLASCIAETTFSDAEWIEGPVGSNTPDFPWAPSSLPAGNYDFPVRAYRPNATGQIRSVFLDSGGTALATGAWHALTGGYANYSDNLTIAATSTHFRLETQA